MTDVAPELPAEEAPPVVESPAPVVAAPPVEEKTVLRDEALRLLKKAENETGPFGDRLLSIADRYLALAKDIEAL